LHAGCFEQLLAFLSAGTAPAADHTQQSAPV
jgi:hypothetical protein